jgi:uncharacterized membrane protein
MARRKVTRPATHRSAEEGLEPPARYDSDGFRLRGTEVTRLEGFSDAMFAFALTLLVVSLEVPHTFAELKDTLSGFLGFALCFLWLVSLWFQHRTFFQRYGLDDQATIVWNMVLLFLVMFFVYPLKYLVTLLMGMMFGVGAAHLREEWSHPGAGHDMVILLVVYGLGYIAVHATLLMLHLHALSKREELELDPAEVLMTHESVWVFWIYIGVAAISVAIAWIGGEKWVAIAGWFYMAIGPARAIPGPIFRRKIEAMRASLALPQR